MNKERGTPNRIPIRFLDEEGQKPAQAASTPDDAEGEGGLTSDELGRASIYEDATEMQRRIDRGGEEDDTPQGRDRADDADTAGSLDPSETEESRNDLDTTPPSTDAENTNRGAGETAGTSDANDSPRQASPTAGPLMAELVATRAELRRVEAQVKKWADERAELQDKLARRQADFENYRKRMERERSETYNRVVGEVVSRLFPVMDNLSRALAAESLVQRSESDEFRHFLHGVELISKQLSGVVEALGIEPVESVGHRFDPHVHEAIAAEESDEFEPDVVMEEVVRGYRLGEKLLRPAMVKVAK